MKKILQSLFGLLIFALMLSSCTKEDIDVPPSPPIANGGQSQSIILPVSTVTLSGSGSSTNGKITGYLWSLVSGPNVPVIASPSSPSTIISKLTTGKYIFQFLVIDSIGLTGVDTVSVTVSANNAPIQTFSIQPTNNPTEFHFWGNARQNQSGQVFQLEAGTWTSGGETVYIRGAVKFDFSSIPANSTIISAKLSLYSTPNPQDGNQSTANSGTNNSFFIRRIMTNWTPAGSAWLNQPSTTTTDQISVPHTDLPFLDVKDVDVTALVLAMQASNNYGFMISLQNEVYYNTRQFCSSMYSDASKHPKLVITYQ